MATEAEWIAKISSRVGEDAANSVVSTEAQLIPPTHPHTFGLVPD